MPELIVSKGSFERGGQRIPATLRNVVDALMERYPRANITLVGADDVRISDITLRWGRRVLNSNEMIELPLRSSDTPAPDVCALTRRLAAGDEAAFREFHVLYFDRLYHFLLVVTRGQEHAAQDALQETLLRVARHAREFDREEMFWGWLKAVARNAARDGGRKQRRYLALLERFALRRIDLARSGHDCGDDNRLRSLLEEGLAGLELSDRNLIEAKYVRGATIAEIATELDATEKAVESRLLRVRRRLGETLMKILRIS